MEVVVAMDSQQFYEELMNDTRARAELNSDFTESAFLQEVTDRLVDAEEVAYLTPVHFAGTGSSNRRLAVSAYDMDETDDSVALAIVYFQDGSRIGTFTETEARRLFSSVVHYIEESMSGSFQIGREESSEEYELAETLRRRGRSVTRYRLYLLTKSLFKNLMPLVAGRAMLVLAPVVPRAGGGPGARP